MKFLVIVLLFVCFIPYTAHAQEGTKIFKTDFYSTIYLDAFYNNPSSGDSSFDVFQSSESSNFGVRASYGKLTGAIELGLNPDEIVRLLYISYQFNDKSKIVFGRDTDIANYSFGQVSLDENGLAGYGTLTFDRSIQVRYTYDAFEVALINSSRDGDEVLSLEIPRLEATYTFNGNGNETILFLTAGYFEFADVVNTANVMVEQDSMVAGHIGLGGNQTISAFTLNYSLFVAYNSSIYGALGDVRFNQVYHDAAGNANNILSYGGAIGIGYAITKVVTIQAGIGYMASTSDTDIVGNKTDQELGSYINAPITFNDYFQLVPEVSYVDHITDFYGRYAGANLYAGLHFVATF